LAGIFNIIRIEVLFKSIVPNILNTDGEPIMTDEQLLQWYDRACEFHCHRAPGLLIGIAMIDVARTELGQTQGKMNAVCESVSCLCDVTQLLTGCTIGNRYLKIHGHLGRFALTLFDRDNGNGIRVFIDLDRIDASETPELHKFFFRQRSAEVKAGGPARAESARIVVDEFMKVRHKVIKTQKVSVHSYGKESKLPAARCEKCHESFLKTGEETVCEICSGNFSYFDIRS